MASLFEWSPCLTDSKACTRAQHAPRDTSALSVMVSDRKANGIQYIIHWIICQHHTELWVRKVVGTMLLVITKYLEIASKQGSLIFKREVHF